MFALVVAVVAGCSLLLIGVVATLLVSLPFAIGAVVGLLILLVFSPRYRGLER